MFGFIPSYSGFSFDSIKKWSNCSQYLTMRQYCLRKKKSVLHPLYDRFISMIILGPTTLNPSIFLVLLPSLFLVQFLHCTCRFLRVWCTQGSRWRTKRSNVSLACASCVSPRGPCYRLPSIPTGQVPRRGGWRWESHFPPKKTIREAQIDRHRTNIWGWGEIHTERTHAKPIIPGRDLQNWEHL